MSRGRTELMRRFDKFPMVVIYLASLQAEGNAGGCGSDSEAQTADNCIRAPLPKNK